MKKKIITLLATIAVAASIATGVITATASDTYSWQIDEIRSEYELGDGFVVPDATFTLNGATVDATYSVVFPDGRKVSAKSFGLTQTGTYSVEYIAKIGGKFYNESKTFVVKANAVSYDKEVSSVVYGTTTEYGSDTCNTGLTVSLAQNDVLTFNELIDVSSLGKNDNLIGAYVLPSRQGSADFNGLKFTLTDSRDESVTLTITVIRHSAEIDYNYLSYVKAGGNGQPLVGFEHNGWNKLHVNDEWGTAIYHSFTASFADGTAVVPSGSRIELFYDVGENALYTKFNISEEPYIVTDFDNPDYYSALWSGFPSGKARLSVSAFDYEGTKAKFFIYDVFGIELNGITEREVRNTSAPDIAVNVPDEIPFAQVGSDYPLFTATAYNDYDGDCAVNASVYFDYYNETARTSVTVKDGKFTAVTDGVYTIVYSSRNSFGVEGVEYVDVIAKPQKDIPPITIAAISEPVTECAVGDRIGIADIAAVGGTGTLRSEKFAVSGDTEVPVDGDTVILPFAGKWKIKYIVTDYVGNRGEYEYDVNVSADAKPIFYPKPQAYPIMLNGGAYVFEEFYAKVYAQDGSYDERIAYVEVTDKNGKSSYKTGSDKYIAVADNNEDEITLRYYIEENGEKKYYDEEYKAKVVLPYVGSGNSRETVLSNYFVTNGVEKSLGENGMTVTARESDGKTVFANMLLGEGFYAEIVSVSVKSTFDGLYVKLTDALNDRNAIRADLLYDGRNTTFAVNGSSVKPENGFKNDGYTFAVKYEGGYFSVGNTSLAVKKTIFGEDFNGFADKVYVEIGFINAAEGGAFVVSKISNQNITNVTTKDRSSPVIRVNGEVGGRYSLGDEYVISSAFVGDVLAPNSVLTMTVKDPDGESVKATDGTVLENADGLKSYKIKLSRIGLYSVVYTSTESSDWGWHFDYNNTYSFSISSTDTEAPKITLKGNFAKTIKLGGNILFPDYSVSDNVSKKENIEVNRFVINPNGKIIYIPKNSNAFKPEYVGEYEVYITVTDEVGNRVIVSGKVTVTE